MFLDMDTLPVQQRYKIASGTILPRPIAWVSTVDPDGVPNLAPFSFFTVASTDPLTLLFCPSYKPDGSKKDTWRNVEATGEFVVNLVNEDTVEAMNRSAATLPPGVSEFQVAGVTPAPSVHVRPPRVAEAPVAYECRCTQILDVGRYAVILGQVVGIHIDDRVYDGNYVDLEALRPVGRLYGSLYCRVRDIFALERP